MIAGLGSPPLRVETRRVPYPLLMGCTQPGLSYPGQYLWPRVIPAKLVPYLIRERESRRQGAWELDARLRGHDVLLAIVGESHRDGKRTLARRVLLTS